jgi:hypothetical protein
LKNVFCIVWIPHHAQSRVVHRPGIQAVQFELRIAASFAAAFYQVAVGL